MEGYPGSEQGCWGRSPVASAASVAKGSQHPAGPSLAPAFARTGCLQLLWQLQTLPRPGRARGLLPGGILPPQVDPVHATVEPSDGQEQVYLSVWPLQSLVIMRPAAMHSSCRFP